MDGVDLDRIDRMDGGCPVSYSHSMVAGGLLLMS